MVHLSHFLPRTTRSLIHVPGITRSRKMHHFKHLIKLVWFLLLLNNVDCIKYKKSTITELEALLRPIIVGRTRGFYCMNSIKTGNNNVTLSTLERLQQDVLCDIDSYKRPVKDPNKITYVTVKFRPIFFEIIQEQEILRVATMLELYWTDEYIRWQPSKYGSLSEMKTSHYDIWYPKITSYDAGTAYRFIDEMDRIRFDDVLIKSNGAITLRGAGSLFGPCIYDTKDWPFEEWTCMITLSKTSDENNMVLTNSFDPSTNIDLSALEENRVWKVVSNPPFGLTNKGDSNVIELAITVQRHVPYYQTMFIFPGVALLLLSLSSFWLTNKVYCRMLINMLTTLVQLTFLDRMFSLLEDVSSRGVTLCSFYIDTMFASFIGILFAVLNAKLLSKITDPPAYVIGVIGVIAAVPYIGPVFSYFINDDINGPTTVEDDEVSLVTGVDKKGGQKWRIISNFLDKCAFLLIISYFVVFYLLRLLI